MVRRKNEKRPNPPGGPAAERLRQFEIARGLPPDQPSRPEVKEGTPKPSSDGREKEKGGDV